MEPWSVNNVYQISGNNVVMYCAKTFGNMINTKKEELEFYFNCFGLERGEYRATGFCNLCSLIRRKYMSYPVKASKYSICDLCKDRRVLPLVKTINGKNFYVNDKNQPLKMVSAHENKGYFQLEVKSDKFDFFTISNIPWFHISNDSTCQLCETNIKYYRHICKQCYDFSLGLLYQQYYKVLLITNSIQEDIYANIHLLFLYLIDEVVGDNYHKYLLSKIPMKVEIKKEELVEEEIEYFYSEEEQPDYGGLGHFNDSEE